MKRKIWNLGIAFALALGLCGCGADAGAEKSLYDQGLEVVSLLDEMAENEMYISSFSSYEEIQTMLGELGNADYTEPDAVYAITISEENLAAYEEWTLLEESASEELQKQMQNKFPAALINQVNAMEGVTTLAAASICTAEKSFVSHEITENTIYLYTYEDTVPVAVTFVVGEDNTVIAKGCFIMYSEFTCGSEQEIRDFFKEVSVEVERVTK